VSDCLGWKVHFGVRGVCALCKLAAFAQPSTAERGHRGSLEPGNRETEPYFVALCSASFRLCKEIHALEWIPYDTHTCSTSALLWPLFINIYDQKLDCSSIIDLEDKLILRSMAIYLFACKWNSIISHGDQWSPASFHDFMIFLAKILLLNYGIIIIHNLFGSLEFLYLFFPGSSLRNIQNSWPISHFPFYETKFMGFLNFFNFPGIFIHILINIFFLLWKYLLASGSFQRNVCISLHFLIYLSHFFCTQLLLCIHCWDHLIFCNLLVLIWYHFYFEYFIYYI